MKIVPLLTILLGLAGCHWDVDNNNDSGRGRWHTLGGVITVSSGGAAAASLNGLVLANGPDLLTVNGSGGPFTMAIPLPYGSVYQLTVRTQPVGMSCVTDGSASGTMAAQDVTGIVVTCAPRSYRLGGVVTLVTPAGITRSVQGLVLQNTANGDSYAVGAGASSFLMPAAVPFGSAYALAVTGQPVNVTCAVANGAGSMPAADVTTIAVTCTNARVLHKSFLFAPNYALGSMSVFSQDPSGGTLTPTAGGTPVGNGPNVIAASPSGRFVYVPNLGDSTLTGFSIDPVQGALAPLPGFPMALQSIGQSAVFTPSGSSLYVVTGNDLRGFSVDATTGALKPVPGSPYALAGAYASAVNPQGSRLYVANYTTALLSVYAIDATTGALTEISGSPFAIVHSALALAFDPTGKHLYVATNGQGLAAYQIGAGGAPTALPGSPFGLAQTGYALAVDPSGQFVLVATHSDGMIYEWSRDAVSGQLTPTSGSPYPAAAGASAVLFDTAGTHVYVYGHLSATIAAFNFDASRGALTPVAGSPFSNVDGGYSLALATTSY